MTIKKPPYVIVHAGTIRHLETLVNEGIAEGYTPQGGPFNASLFNPPHPTLAQAMTLANPSDDRRNFNRAK